MSSEHLQQSITDKSVSEYFARLVHLAPDGSTVEKNVLRNTTLIGSGQGSNVRLMSEDVSHSHAVMTFDERDFRIWDLRSRTGVFVNGQRVTFARLHDGDTLRISNFQFTFRTNVPATLKKGIFIDDYRILGLLGTGGIGWLYHVEHIKSGQQFAMKVLTRRGDQRGINEQELRIRFHFEAKISKQLQHPSLIKAHAYEHRADIDYIIMDLVEAITLQELVERDGRVRFPLACEIIRQTAMALDFIHRHGPVHRDVKPANVLIQADGTVKLCDFGLVFLGDDPLEKTLAEQLAGDCLGTADFISPEQSHNSYDIDRRADLYSLGCTLYYALCGRIPFPARNNLEKLHGHRNLQAADLKQFVPDLPDSLNDLIIRSMQKNPDQRFETLQDFAEALATYCQSQAVPFDFSRLLKMRNRLAQARLMDRHREHHLDRIPPQITQMVLASDPLPTTLKSASKEALHSSPHSAFHASPDDTVPASANAADFIRNLPESLRTLISQWKSLPPEAQQEILNISHASLEMLADD